MSTHTEELNDQMRVRREKLQSIEGVAYRNGLRPEHHAAALHQEFDAETKEALEPKNVQVSVAGRVMLIRHFGKAGFVQIQDGSGRLQLFMQKNSLGEETFARYKSLDIGDIIYATGKLFKTKTDELTVEVSSFDLLTKSLRPLPEKYHGISDVEVRYRQRYLDLIMNEETRRVFQIRSKVVDAVRRFFVARGFMEVETPMMHPLVSGATARPFKTHHNTLDMDLYLRIAPELYLKRLLVGGFERVFEINRNFRNEGISTRHNPEFTMIEFYQAYATYEDLIKLTEALFKEVAQQVLGTTTVHYQDADLEFGGEWKRMTMEESVLEISGFKDASKIRDAKALTDYLKSKGVDAEESQGAGHLVALIFEEEVESTLIQPTFITHFPLEVSPLARKSESDPYLCDRFELFIYGREVGNAFSELNDPIDQRERFEEQVRAKAAGDQEACDMDEDYIVALEYGMPPAAGEGIGIDRMVMLFANAPSIRDVILFPQLRHSSL